MRIKWRVIKDHPNYELNRLGQVRNRRTGKILKPFDDNRGYLRVTLDGVNVKLHLIPYSSLGCESGLLEVITAENICIYQGKKVVEVPMALLGISRHRLSSDGEFNMLVNSNIID